MGKESERLKYCNEAKKINSPEIETKVKGKSNFINDLNEKFACKFLKKLNSCPSTLHE